MACVMCGSERRYLTFVVDVEAHVFILDSEKALVSDQLFSLYLFKEIGMQMAHPRE